MPKKDSERYIYPVNIKLKQSQFNQLTEMVGKYRPYSTTSSFLREVIATLIEDKEFKLHKEE